MNRNTRLGATFVALAVAFSAGLLFVNVYNSVVDASNWGSQIPVSIEAARAYFKAATPGTFFRVASPLNQLLALLALAFAWKGGSQVRWTLGIALLLAIGADALTFGYFYPRNELMFGRGGVDIATLQAAQSEWASMNWVRSGLLLITLGLNFKALLTLVSPHRAFEPTAAQAA